MEHGDTFTYLLPHYFFYFNNNHIDVRLNPTTKTEDNCSYSYASMLPNDRQQESKFDAFQYYSSDLLRLKTHLLSSNHDDDELSVLASVNDILRSAGLSGIAAKNNASKDKNKSDSKSKRRRGNNSEPIKNEAVTQPQRKTRSFHFR